MRVLAAGLTLLTLACAGNVQAQQAYRCTDAQGRVTYQQSPCPAAATERKVDTSPANPDYDPAQRERVLKQGEEAQRRLDERAAREEAERKRRQEEREREEQRERELREREEAREAAVNATYWPGNRPVTPSRPKPPRPQPKPPAPAPKAPAPR
jgi:hypothetical protein